jgi:hypothetical protein
MRTTLDLPKDLIDAAIFLKVRNQRKIIDLLHSIDKLKLSIDWNEIIGFQFKCLKNGLNGISIPALVVAQNAKQNNSAVYFLDNHFRLMKDILELHLTD